MNEVVYALPGVNQVYQVESDVVPPHGIEMKVNTRHTDSVYKVRYVEYRLVEKSDKHYLEVHVDMESK